MLVVAVAEVLPVEVRPVSEVVSLVAAIGQVVHERPTVDSRLALLLVALVEAIVVPALAMEIQARAEILQAQALVVRLQAELLQVGAVLIEALAPVQEHAVAVQAQSLPGIRLTQQLGG